MEKTTLLHLWVFVFILATPTLIVWYFAHYLAEFYRLFLQPLIFGRSRKS